MATKNKRIKITKVETPEFKKLRKSLKEVIKLKKEGNYQNRDFDQLVDAL
jgi:hypothetical protein